MPRKKKIIQEPVLVNSEPKVETIIEKVESAVDVEIKTPEAEEKFFAFVNDELQLSKYLKVKDFTRSATATAKKIDNRLPITLLEDAKKIASLYDKVYEKFNGNVQISSGYRSPSLNSAVGGSSTSQHVKAQAIDIQGKRGVKNADIIKWIQTNLQYNQLIWEYGNAFEPRWVHVGYGTKMQYLRIGVKSEKGLFMHISDEIDI